MPSLDAAVAVLAPAVMPFPNHVAMQTRRSEAEPKYLTRHSPLTPALIRAHLQGQVTLGAGLYWPDPCGPGGRKARVIAWDSDHDLRSLIHGAHRLARAGLQPLLVRNPSKEASGHLWLLLDEAIDPTMALAAAETIAPELAAVPERFPHPKKADGARLRLPGGVYQPVAARPIPVEVAHVPEVGQPQWVDGTTPTGWAVIAAAQSRTAILAATFIPREARPQVPPPRSRLAQQRMTRANGSEEDVFAHFNAQNSVDSLVILGRDGKFAAPWREERTPSVQVYPDGHWHDYGPDGRHGKDAFDLWCALQGYWDEGANRPDRKAGLRALRESERRV